MPIRSGNCVDPDDLDKNPSTAPQFSSLFTRLLENRRRAASQTETDR